MTRTLKFGGLTGSGWSRTTKATFGPGGKVVEQSYADQANGQASVTKATYTYDDRGNPKALTWTPPGVAARPVATQTRNVAGLVTQRRAALAGFPGTTGSWKTFNTDFAYDAPTRVASQTVTNGGSTPLAKQQLDYYGADDPGRLRHWLGTVAYDFTFGYDRQHELTNVSEAGNKYSATFAYGALVGGTPSGSGKFRSATVGGTPQSGGQVVARNVTYDYADSVDPEAPSGLVNVVGGARLRSYGYDAAGNQTEVHAGPVATPPRPTDRFVYDGDDQLRRATKYSPGTTTVTGSEEYFYDHAGQRVGVVTRNAAGAVTKLRAFVGDTEVELSAAGAVTQAYAYLALGTPVAKVVSPAGGWTSAGTSVTWANSPSSLELQYHGLSSNTLLSVRPNGVVQAGFVYAPYGDVVQTSGATSGTIAGQRRRFNDKFKDDLTGLSYYGVRYYDGLALGWTQADPMYRFVPDAAWTEPRRAGLYQFVLGNPVRYVDLDGRDPWMMPPFSVDDIPGIGAVTQLGDSAKDFAAGVAQGAKEAGRQARFAANMGGVVGVIVLVHSVIGGGGTKPLMETVAREVTRLEGRDYCLANSPSPNPAGSKQSPILNQGSGAGGGVTAKALPTPGGMKAPAFGKLIGWTGGKTGKDMAENFAKTAELIKGLPGRLSDLRTAGVTKSMAQQWADFYKNEAAANAKNPNAGPRAWLMQTLADLL